MKRQSILFCHVMFVSIYVYQQKKTVVSKFMLILFAWGLRWKIRPDNLASDISDLTTHDFFLWEFEYQTSFVYGFTGHVTRSEECKQEVTAGDEALIPEMLMCLWVEISYRLDNYRDTTRANLRSNSQELFELNFSGFRFLRHVKYLRKYKFLEKRKDTGNWKRKH